MGAHVKRVAASTIVAALLFGLVGCGGSGTDKSHPKVAMALSKGVRPHITAGIEIVKFIGELALGGSLSLKDPEQDWMRLVIQDRANGGRETVYDVRLPDSFKVVTKGRTEITKAAESRTITIDVTDGAVESLEFVPGTGSGGSGGSVQGTKQRIVNVVLIVATVLFAGGFVFAFLAGWAPPGDKDAAGVGACGVIGVLIGAVLFGIVYLCGYPVMNGIK